MGIYFAPLEGITGHIFRNTYEKHFGGVEKYFTPFITTNQHFEIKKRDLKDILPENNRGLHVVPQVLTNSAEQFVDLAGRLAGYGYWEINLNLGCPSRTVVPKRKGSGLLAYPEQLDRMLEEIFEGCGNLDISIKTRLGIQEPDEFFEILEIYNRYPVSELTIHPRVQMDYYKNHPHMEVFAESLKRTHIPVCYNGDLFTAEEIRAFQGTYPEVKNLMLGRGLLKAPSLPEELDGRERDLKRWKAFLEELCDCYVKELGSTKNTLFKMKELWFYLFQSLPESEEYAKQMKKTTDMDKYRNLVAEILRTQRD